MKRGRDEPQEPPATCAIKLEPGLISGGGGDPSSRHMFNRPSAVSKNPRPEPKWFVPRISALGKLQFFAVASHRDPDMLGIFRCKWGEIEHLVTSCGPVTFRGFAKEADARRFYTDSNGPGDPPCVDPDGGSA